MIATSSCMAALTIKRGLYPKLCLLYPKFYPHCIPIKRGKSSFAMYSIYSIPYQNHLQNQILNRLSSKRKNIRGLLVLAGVCVVVWIRLWERNVQWNQAQRIRNCRRIDIGVWAQTGNATDFHHLRCFCVVKIDGWIHPHQ